MPVPQTSGWVTNPVFKAMFSAEDTAKVMIMPNFEAAHENIHNILETLVQHKKVVEMHAHENLADAYSWDRFCDQFKAATLTCAEQNCLKTQMTANRLIGSYSYLKRAKIAHTKSVRMVTGQLGVMDDVEAGLLVVHPRIRTMPPEGIERGPPTLNMPPPPGQTPVLTASVITHTHTCGYR